MKTRDYALQCLEQEVKGRPGGWRSTVGFTRVNSKAVFVSMIVTVVTLEDADSDDDQQYRLVAYRIQESQKVLRPDHPTDTKLPEWHLGTLHRVAADVSRGLGATKQESLVMSF